MLHNFLYYRNIFILITTLVVINSCQTVHIFHNNDHSVFLSQERELEYYYAFTEATKQAIFNNFNEAIILYNKCLKYNTQSSAVYFQLSNIYVRIGNLTLAKEFAKKAIQIDKNNKWYLLNLASIYQLQRNLDSTIVVFKKLIKIDNNNLNHLLKLGILYNEVSEFNRALKLTKLIDKKFGRSEQLFFLKYNIYTKQGKFKSATKVLENGVLFFPNNINMIGLLAEQYAEQNKIERATNLYRIIVDKDSLDSKVQLSYAEFLLNQKEKDEAYSFYVKAMENPELSLNSKISIFIDFLKDNEKFLFFKEYIIKLLDLFKVNYIDDIRIRSLCVDIYIKAELYSNALNELRFIISKKKDNYLFWRQLISIENFIGNYDSVIYYSNQALGFFNEQPELYIMKGLAQLQLDSNEHAITTLKKGIDICDNKDFLLQLYNYLAEAYNNIGEYEESNKYFENVLELDNKNLLVRNNYSYYLALRDEHLDKAKKLSKFTIDKDPKNSTYLDTYAWILYKKGEFTKALEYLEKAIEYGGERNAEILDHYGDVLYKLNRVDDAIKIWKKAINFTNDNDRILNKIMKIQ